MDGHDSHLTFEFLEYCISHDIICICLPAHSTHLLQPLDVGLFGPLAQAYSNSLDEWERTGHKGVDRGEFFKY